MARHVWRQTSRSIRQWKRLVKAWTLHSKDKEWRRGVGVRGRVDQRVGIHIARRAGVDRRVDAQTAVPLRQVMDMPIGAAEHAPEVRKIHSS